MKPKIVLLFIIIILSNSCASWKKNLKADGNYEVAINNAITDFLNTSKPVVKEFNSFNIIEITNENTLGISILGDSNKWILGEIKVGDMNEYFPNRYKEINGKLFYWNDTSVALSQSMIDVMKKYNILDTTKYPNYMIPDSEGRSSLKGAVHYYFCKSNYLIYKKVKTTISIGYYKPPNLSCK